MLRLEVERLVLPLRVLRDRVLELPRFVVPPDLVVPDLLDVGEVVLLLREPGGEDVRVAMVINVGHSHTSHRDHSERVVRDPPGATRKEDCLWPAGGRDEEFSRLAGPAPHNYLGSGRLVAQLTRAAAFHFNRRVEIT